MLSAPTNQTNLVAQSAARTADKILEEEEPSTSTARAKTTNINAVEQSVNTTSSMATQNSNSSFYDSALLTPPDFLSEEDKEIIYNPDERRYCICNQISYGTMIGCDNKTCPYEWFHFACVGIKRAPKGKWYCPLCKASMRTRGKRKRKLAELYS